MANANTFASFSSAYPSGHPFNLPASFTTTSATETAFLLSNGTQAIIHVPTGTEILGSQTLFSPNANAAIAREGGRSAAWFGENRPFFNSTSFSSKAFKVRATGYIAGGLTTATLVSATVALYAAITNTATVTTGTKIASTQLGLGGAKASWWIDTTWIWDPTSQNLQLLGNAALQIGASTTATTLAAITSLALSSVNFGVTYTFATSSTSNTVGMTELSIEQV